MLVLGHSQHRKNTEMWYPKDFGPDMTATICSYRKKGVLVEPGVTAPETITVLGGGQSTSFLSKHHIGGVSLKMILIIICIDVY